MVTSWDEENVLSPRENTYQLLLLQYQERSIIELGADLISYS